jgi:hypothetical protein
MQRREIKRDKKISDATEATAAIISGSLGLWFMQH